MRVAISLLLLLHYHASSGTVSSPAAGAKQKRNIDTMTEALQYFKPFTSPFTPLLTTRPSITYIVVTGAVYAHRVEALWGTWGRAIAAPDRIFFSGDAEIQAQAMRQQYPFLSTSRTIPMQYSSGAAIYGRHRVTRMKPHRRSQLKWLDAILYLGRIIEEKGTLSSTDWFVFADDDTLVLPSALASLLSEHDHADSILIGKGGKDCFKMCGGAGFAISKPLLKQLFHAREGLVKAFFTGYSIAGRPPQMHSDVVLSHFVLSGDAGPAEFVRRQEFKNFSPIVAAKWASTRGEGLGRVVSFHKMGSDVQYREVFEYFYARSHIGD